MAFSKTGGAVSIRFDWDQKDREHLTVTLSQVTLEGGNVISGQFNRQEVHSVIGFMNEWLRRSDKVEGKPDE